MPLLKNTGSLNVFWLLEVYELVVFSKGRRERERASAMSQVKIII